MAQSPLLELETTGHSEPVKIDGAVYNLADFESFTPLEQINFLRQSKRITGTLQSDDTEDLTEKESADFNRLTSELFERIAGNIPDEIRAKLLPASRVRVVNHYFLAFAEWIGAKAEIVEPLPSGPEESSPESSDSTEATPTTG